ncbi:MAG: (2Fe-2S)-binding protein [Deltaproteobacteria bacterium]|nr:(2Fe-2S)-binding protein [Deltaproteobacteria bacterium]
MKSLVTMTINHEVKEIEVDHGMTLLELLRDVLKIKSVHRSCGEGECGACTVLLDGQAICSCLTLAAQTDGKQVLTLEGLIKNGQAHPLMTAFAEHKAVQCGYCTPGVIMTAYSLINDNDALTDKTIRKGIEGNICRCTGYVNIVKAIKAAAKSKNDGLWW